MFEMICEIARMTTRNTYLRKRATTTEKAHRVVAVRPIERARRTKTNKTPSRRDPKYTPWDDSESTFENYDANGKVRLQTRMKYSPLSKKA